MSPSPEALKAAFKVTVAVSEAIREAKEMPSGVLYAFLLAKLPGLTEDAYKGLLRNLTGAGLVKNEGHLLRWIGP